MSANNARRRRSGGAEVTHLGQRRLEKAQRLVAVRDRLAISAAEADAHQLEGAVDLARHVMEVEAEIQLLAPRLHDDLWPGWVERDLQLAHDDSHESPSCSICGLLKGITDPWALHPGRAG